MDKELWDGFAETIRIDVPLGNKPVLKPTAEVLDAYELRTGVRLPNSYRQFIRAFGPGTIAQDFEIGAPGYPRRKFDMTKLDEFYKYTHTADVLEEFCNDPGRASRLILFCMSIGSDLIGWDPQEVTDRRRHEYAVYEMMHEGYKLVRVAGTFREFIEGYCLGDGYWQLGNRVPFDERKRGPRRVFTPASKI